MPEKTYPVYVVGQNIFDFHYKEPALVIGLEFIKNNSASFQLCLKVRFINGDENYIPWPNGEEKNGIFKIIHPDEIELKVKEQLDFSDN